jgi:uncharacterized membrane protein YuzA (DUF378 family)
MRKELGKWLMDIAKYIVTAVILSSIFNDVAEKRIVFILGGITAVFSLLIGLYYVKDKEDKKKKRRK